MGNIYFIFRVDYLLSSYKQFWNKKLIKSTHFDLIGMINSAKFFNTQINLYTHKPSLHLQKNTSTGSVSQRLKQLKQRARKLDFEYKRALSCKTHTQKSINLLSRNVQKMRVDFMKLYQNKKVKLLNKQKVQNHILQSKELYLQTKSKTKQRKLLDQLQLSTTKNQDAQNNLIRQQRNKKQKQKLKKEIKLKNMQAYVFAKAQYNKIRQQQETLTDRNKKITQILQMRAHINYVEKIQKQLGVIHEYEDIMKELQDNYQILQEIRPATTGSKIFFLTSRNIKSTQRQTRATRATREGVYTSQTTR